MREVHPAGNASLCPSCQPLPALPSPHQVDGVPLKPTELTPAARNLGWRRMALQVWAANGAPVWLVVTRWIVAAGERAASQLDLFP